MLRVNLRNFFSKREKVLFLWFSGGEERVLGEGGAGWIVGGPRALKTVGWMGTLARYQIGAHVRDAACYVVWALARAYDKNVMVAHVRTLAAALLPVALFDREVNCRRAAAAAVQD